MKVTKSDGIFIIRIDKEDSVIDELIRFGRENGVKSGIIAGIGAVLNPVISYFDVHEKKYVTKEFEGEYELLSCNGNFSIKDGEVFPHLHVVLGSRNFSTIGGHLNSCRVSGAGEFFVKPLSEITIERQYNDDVGLFIWNL
ncbi:MAG: DNA-binding protein [Candidatus Marinimicrobia bacterium]|nr:DNA-binding protein [Candidatus Neomarinimicrobiota bacterium]